MRHLLLVLAGLWAAGAHAQLKLGNNATAVNTNALLELESTNQGVLLPRVALTATTAAAPLSAFVAGMVVYNTATAGTSPNNVQPGLYISDGTKWMRLIPQSAGNSTSWNTTGNTGSSAFLGTTDNTDLAVRTNNTERLRVTKAGSLYGGSGSFMPDTAQYGIAWGSRALGTRNYSAAIGYQDTATGTGNGAWAIGYRSIATGDRALAMGNASYAGGTYSMAAGHTTAANAWSMTAMGSYNAIDSTASATAAQSKDPLFVVGKGTSSAARANALTVLKSGQTLINTSGVSGYVAPRADLDVRGSGAVIWPTGTTAERPSVPVKGMVRFNTDSGKFEGFDGTAWFNMN